MTARLMVTDMHEQFFFFGGGGGGGGGLGGLQGFVTSLCISRSTVYKWLAVYFSRKNKHH